MNQIITKGIVLSRTNFQEADRILTLLTPDHGKVSVVAKGVRKSRSKMAAGTELLSISEIGFIRGKGDLSTLTTARLDKHFGTIVQYMDRTMYAYDLLKRVNRLTEDNAEQEYFNLLVATFEALNNPEIELNLIQLWVLLHLVTISGHLPELGYDNRGIKLAESPHYSFDAEAMAFYVHPEGLYKTGHIKLLRLCLSQPLNRLSNVTGLESYVLPMLRLMQTVNQVHLHA